ncbi:MAG: flagellar motor switch protein FliN [Pirellulales bacterium]|nr:flagellar motor switch protein FliN [Pirellulales bacterium]
MLSGGDKPAAPPKAEDDDKLLAQDDIEKLLSQAGKTSPPPPKQAAARASEAAAATTAAVAAAEERVAEKDVEYLLQQAEEALKSIDGPPDGELPHGVASFRFQQFSGAPASTESASLDLIRDVDLDVQIELGRTHMYLEDVLKLRKGSVVPLDKLAGDPVDIYVNGRLIARGEVLVLNDNFCVRVAELIAGTGAH